MKGSCIYRILRPAAFALLFFVAVSCDKIHFFPDPELAVDPTEVTAQFSVSCELSLELGELVTKSDAGYDRRYLVEIRDAGYTDTLVQSFLITRDASDESNLVVNTKLHTRKYKIFIWSDFVRKGETSDLYYDTSNGSDLSSIHLPSVRKYVGGTDYKAVQTAIAELDLTPYVDEWYVDITVPVQMENPMAKITFLAIDMEEYAKTANFDGSLENLAGELKSEIYYNGYLPTGFNALTGRLNDSEVGYSFSQYAEYPYRFRDADCSLVGFDYVFVNGESSSVTVTVKVYKKDGTLINTAGDIQVPIHRGMETVVLYKFYTKEYVPGIGIDPGFDGEFNVYV